ncbi:MAG: HD domain-containing protein [Bacteroidales bacterium]|nr:HD domain-containing protein [Bacteroidales bacterium]
MKRLKIINDSVYGFINVDDDLIYALIEHPFFQRLSRIKQLGLTYLVYPGAIHTRFHHSLGALHLMGDALRILKLKGCDISDNEMQAVKIAILLHDIGHGPYSHILENSIIFNINHENMSDILMNFMNSEFDNQLGLALKIFNNKYHKHFLHKLVSSQLDIDRLDYLKRDSYFTGVSEGIINSDRIINMLTVWNDELAVESKGIYSIEKFLVARRLMYWQVYFHKTVLAAEYLIIKIIDRARKLIESGELLTMTPALQVFLEKKYNLNDFSENSELIKAFAELDDYDVFTSVKMWSKSKDRVLALLSDSLINRRLSRVDLQDKAFEQCKIDNILEQTKNILKLSDEELPYFVFCDYIKNNPYNYSNDQILIVNKDGSVKDIRSSEERLNIEALSKTAVKHFLYYPKFDKF